MIPAQRDRTSCKKVRCGKKDHLKLVQAPISIQSGSVAIKAMILFLIKRRSGLAKRDGNMCRIRRLKVEF